MKTNLIRNTLASLFLAAGGLLLPEHASAETNHLEIALSTNGLSLTVAGNTNNPVAILMSTDLVSYVPIVTNTLDSSTFRCTNVLQTTNSAAFFKAVLIPPPAPTGLAATFNVEKQTVELAWSLPPGSFYTIVERAVDSPANFATLTSVGSQGSPYTNEACVVELAADRSYYYRVKAGNSGGFSAPSSPVSITVPRLASPTWTSYFYTNATPCSVGFPEVSLHFTAPLGAHKLILQRAQAGSGVFTDIAEDYVYPPVYSIEDSDLDLNPGVTYSYRLLAVSCCGTSSPSATVSVAVPTVPTPTLLSATSRFDRTQGWGALYVDLSWAASDACYTEIQRRTNGQAGYEWVADVDAPSLSYTDEDLTEAGKTYYYRLINHNDLGESAPSTERSVYVPPPAPLLDPADVFTTEVDLYWSEDISNVQHYQIDRKPAGGTWAVIAYPAATDSFYMDFPPVGYTYSYRVRVWAEGAFSAPSNEVTATPMLDQALGVNPADGDTGSRVQPIFKWEAVPQAYDYRLQVFPINSASAVIDAVVPAPNTNYTSSIVLNNLTSYKWHVRARTATGTGNGDWSDFAQFQTR